MFKQIVPLRVKMMTFQQMACPDGEMVDVVVMPSQQIAHHSAVKEFNPYIRPKKIGQTRLPPDKSKS